MRRLSANNPRVRAYVPTPVPASIALAPELPEEKLICGPCNQSFILFALGCKQKNILAIVTASRRLARHGGDDVGYP